MLRKSDISKRQRSLHKIYITWFPIYVVLFNILGFICCWPVLAWPYWNSCWKDDYSRWTWSLVDHRHYSSYLWKIDAGWWFKLDSTTLKFWRVEVIRIDFQFQNGTIQLKCIYHFCLYRKLSINSVKTQNIEIMNYDSGI